MSDIAELTLEDIVAQIAELEKELDYLTKSEIPTSCRSTISQAAKREEQLQAEYIRRINEIRDEKNKAQDELSRFQAGLNDTQNNLLSLREKQAELLKAQAAQEKLDAITSELDELRSQFIWGERLRDYQWDDITFSILAFEAGLPGILNANDMGLGKTFETAATLDILEHKFYQKYDRKPTILWLTKKSLVGTTFKELKKWSPDRKMIKLMGINDKDSRNMMVEMAIVSNAMLITNYDAMNTTSLIMSTAWDFVIMDECHRLKGGANAKPTAIFTNAKEVTEKAKFIIPLTGTPIVNHPKEAWCYLNIFDSELFPSVKDFEKKFCYGYGERDLEGNLIVSINWDKLIFGALKNRVIRRSKSEVNLELPDKEREFRYLEMEGEQLVHYNNLKTHFFTWLDEQKTSSLNATSILSQLHRLRQCAIYPGGIKVTDKETGVTQTLACNNSVKIEEAFDIIEQLTDAGEQVVVFSSQFNDPLYFLGAMLDKANIKSDIITGAESADLEKFQTRFQNSETQVLLINMKTGSEGLNLQKSKEWSGGASHAIFLDLWWNPALNTQAEDRIHRQGQTDPVIIHILQCENSVDQFIAQILEDKTEMISGIMERDELRSGKEWADTLKELL
jgi:SNF2 family DNA or RNA helicase